MLGCAAREARVPAEPDARIAAYVATFRRAEPVLLGTIARADPRFRGRISPDPRPVLFVDPFLFDLRAKALEHVWLEAERCSLPQDVLEAKEGPLADHALEQELLFRAINEELVRLDHEHNQRVTADLVRALGASWPDYHDEKQQHAA